MVFDQAQSQMSFFPVAQQEPVVRPRSLAERAGEILQTIEEYRAGLGLTDALILVHERFVDHEDDEDLRALGELLARARRLSLVQNQLDEDREKLHHGHLDHERREEVGHHYEMLRYEACNYNHRLRNFIEAHREQVSRHELTRWLTTASQGRREWVEGEITGAVSEVALHMALMGLPELRGLRYATLEEDLKGYDFIADWQGKLVTIDAKTGRYHPLSQRKHGHRHLEVSVPREIVNGFRVSKRGLDIVRHETRRVLYDNSGVPHHEAHWHYHGPHRQNFR